MSYVKRDVDAEDLGARRPVASRRRRRLLLPPPGLGLLRPEAEAVAARRRRRRELQLPFQGVRPRKWAAAGALGDATQRAREAVDREAVEAHGHRGEPEAFARRARGRDGVRRGVDRQDRGLPRDGLRGSERDVEDSGLEGRLGGAEGPGEVFAGGGDGEDG